MMKLTIEWYNKPKEMVKMNKQLKISNILI